jgi:hypothetical protein
MNSASLILFFLTTFSGTPQTAATVGQPYDFLPTYVPIDGVSLTFTIVNKPAWAVFNSTTGELSGIPAANDVGTDGNVVITANLSADSVVSSIPLAPFSIAVAGAPASTALPTAPTIPPGAAPVTPLPTPTTGSATVSWSPPTSNTDGSALTDIAGYRIYYGANPAMLYNVIFVPVGSMTHVIDGLAAGYWCFAITTVNSAGVESALSRVVQMTL